MTWLNLPCYSTTSVSSVNSTISTNNASSSPAPGVIAGVVIAILVAIAVLGISIWIFLRRRRARLIPQQDINVPFTVQAVPASDQSSRVLSVGPPSTFDRKGRFILLHKPASDTGTFTSQRESSYAASTSVTGGVVPAVEDVAPPSYQLQVHTSR